MQQGHHLTDCACRLHAQGVDKTVRKGPWRHLETDWTPPDKRQLNVFSTHWSVARYGKIYAARMARVLYKGENFRSELQIYASHAAAERLATVVYATRCCCNVSERAQGWGTAVGDFERNRYAVVAARAAASKLAKPKKGDESVALAGGSTENSP